MGQQVSYSYMGSPDLAYRVQPSKDFEVFRISSNLTSLSVTYQACVIPGEPWFLSASSPSTVSCRSETEESCSVDVEVRQPAAAFCDPFQSHNFGV